MTENEKEFVKKVAADSANMTIEFENIQKAFQLLTGEKEPRNIRLMRKALYDYHHNPLPDKKLPDFMNPDFDITSTLPTTDENTFIEIPDNIDIIPAPVDNLSDASNRIPDKKISKRGRKPKNK